jgi:CRISPR-associated protein Csc3
MKRGRESGKNFEGRRLRYLFCYPTYFFTPETLGMLRLLHDQLQRVSFTTLRRALLTDDDTTVNLDLSVFQRLKPLLLNQALLDTPDQDRLFRLRLSYEEREAITFGFVGIPPANPEAKDAEAWVHPAFLALVLPLVLDVKVVASESMLPLFNEANELPETVAFDGAHAFVRYLCSFTVPDEHAADARRDIRAARLTLDDLGPALRRLTAAYLIHLDGNAKAGAGGYDYHWSNLPALARDLATSPLYAFHYLKKGLRASSSDTLSGAKAALYLNLFDKLAPGGDPVMNHARELTERYRRFYRTKKIIRPSSNAILRPISIVAKSILDTDPRLTRKDITDENAPEDEDALTSIAFGALHKFITNVDRGAADGKIPFWLYPDVRPQELLEVLTPEMEAFACYFVKHILIETFDGDRAALRGKQLNLLKNACEVIYLAEQRREAQERKARGEAGCDVKFCNMRSL